MIRIAYFNDGPLLPIKEGGAERIVNLIRFQNIKDRCQIILYECNRSWTNIDGLKKEDFSSVVIPESTFYSDHEKLISILKAQKIQACIFTNPETLLNIGTDLKVNSFKIIYDCHNVFSLLERRLGNSTKNADYIEFLEYLVGQIADLILPCSSLDLERLSSIGIPRENMKIVENGVDTNKIKFQNNNYTPNNILFLGNIYYQPNLNAIEKIYEYCYTAEQLKDFVFIIAGSAPAEIIRRYQSPRFKFTGYIKDLNSVFKNTKLALAPLTEGSGTRLKILNYLASGIPTITTSIGVEGLEFNMNELYICDDISSFPEVITTILKDDYYKSVAINARRKVEVKYDWRAISNKSLSYFYELLG